MKTSLIPLLLALALAACATQEPVSPASSAKLPAIDGKVLGRGSLEGRILGSLRPGSRFARLEIGMTRAEVESLIGAPFEVIVQSSGTAWVPFYFGSDAWSLASFYKDEGVLVFNADSHLILIDTTTVPH